MRTIPPRLWEWYFLNEIISPVCCYAASSLEEEEKRVCLPDAERSGYAETA